MNALKRLESITDERNSILSPNGIPDDEDDEFDTTQYCCKDSDFFRVKVLVSPSSPSLSHLHLSSERLTHSFVS
jgi:hypothetical protein